MLCGFRPSAETRVNIKNTLAGHIIRNPKNDETSENIRQDRDL